MFKRFLLILAAAALLLSVISCQKDPYQNSIYSEQPQIGLYQDYLATAGVPKEGTDPILATGQEKGKIKKGGLFGKALYFKDSNGDGKLEPYEDWRLTARERATDLVKRMSDDQKTGLLSWLGESYNTVMTRDDKGNKDPSDDVLYYGILGLNDDGTVTKEIKGDRGPATSLAYSLLTDGCRYVNDQPELNPMDELKYNNNVQGLAERAPWGIPFLISNDPQNIGWDGDQMNKNELSKWPYPLGLGAADDLKTTKAFGETIAEEARMIGHHMMLGPQADLATEPRWARISQVISANGDAAAKQMKVLIKAMQGGDTLTPSGIAATVKHFPGSGSIEEGMDSHTPPGKYSVYPGNNLAEHLKPFQSAIDVGAAAVMACYSIIDIPELKDVVNGKTIDEGAAFSTKIMTDLLKKKMGFDGAVVSDWGIAKTSPYGHEDIIEKPKILAEMINAGTYQYGGTNYTDLWKEALEYGLITEDTVNNAVMHALELQFKLGLFENPYVDLKKAAAFWDPKGDALKARFAAGEKAMKKAMVLVKNDDVADSQALLPVLGTSKDYIADVDTNGNGKVDVYFDSAYPDCDSGQAKTKAFSTDKQYLNINFVDDISKADLAIVRIFSRGGTYFGTLGGTPLTFDDPVRVWDHDKQAYTDEIVPAIHNWMEGFAGFGKWQFRDWSQVTGSGGFIGQGFQTYLGGLDSKSAIERTLAAKKANPKLKVIVGMTDSRPGIVSSFINQVDGMYIDFAMTDKAFLDVVFWQDGDKPEGRLPVEIPSTEASVEAQKEDVPGDSANATFDIGFGLQYASMGGYGS